MDTPAGKATELDARVTSDKIVAVEVPLVTETIVSIAFVQVSMVKEIDSLGV